MMTVDTSLKEAMNIAGAVGVTLFDQDSGLTLGTMGGGDGFDLEMAAAGNSQVIRAKRETMRSLNLDENIEDIIISLDSQIHFIRPLKGQPELLLYLAVRKDQVNLAMARLKMRQITANMSV